MNTENKIDVLDCCDLGIAYRCNYRCRMCYFWENNSLGENNVLSTQEWKEVLQQLKELPKSDDYIVNFTGSGEIFLRKDVFSLIKYSRQLNLKMQIITNGSLINKDVSRQIADAGLEFLCFSLDSLNPQTHDFLRGVQGAQRRVLEGIENVSSDSPQTKIGVNTVISKVNLHEIVELTEWVQKNKVISYINFQVITQPFSFTDAPEQTWFKTDENRFLWPDDQQLIHKTINQLIEFKKMGYKLADGISQFNTFRDYFINPLLFIKNGRCNLGKGNVMIIDPVGNVSLCSLVGVIDNLKNGMNLRSILSSDGATEHKRKINTCQRNCHLIVSCYYQEELT